MGAREEILQAVRANRPKLERPAPVVPRFDSAPPASLADLFVKNLLMMGGEFLPSTSSAEALEAVRRRLEGARTVCSVAPEITGNRALSAARGPADLADIDAAVVRASFGVAETGSVLLTDQNLLVNAVAYLAQHLIVLLDPAEIVLNLHTAYARPEFRERRYACFHTGPSATADIEGVLIHGAQGVRSLALAFLPPATRPD